MKASRFQLPAFRGLERPGVQWMVVAGVLMLMALLAATTLTVRRTRGQVEELLGAQQALQATYQKLDAQLARERAAREAFELEVARLRSVQKPTEARADVPTLTLQPPERSSGTPPEPTVTAPDAAQVIQLRLLLPESLAAVDGPFEIVLRDWSTGRTLWSTTAAKPLVVDGRRAVAAYVTGEILAPGTYEIQVMLESKGGPVSVASYVVSIGARGG